MEDVCNIGQYGLGFVDHIFGFPPGDMWGPEEVIEIKERRIRRHGLVAVDVQSSACQMAAFEAFI